MKKRLRQIFSLVGVLIFAYMIYKIGPDNVWLQIKKVGWWLIPVMFVSFLWYVAYTYAWYQFLKPLPGKISFRELFRVKIIGETLNTLTPANFIAGDPARAFLIRHRFPITEGTASIVVDRTLNTIATLIVIIIGTGVALFKMHFLPNNIKHGLPVVLSIASIFVIYIFIHQQKGLFSFIADIAQRLRIKKEFSTKTLEKFQEVDGHIQDFYKRNKRGFWIALGCHLLGRILGIVEIYIVGHVAYPSFAIKMSLLLGAAAPIINVVFAFIPGSLGVMESAYSAILYLLKYPPAVGLTIQIVKRLRSAVWIAIGFIYLGVQGRKKLAEAEVMNEI